MASVTKWASTLEDGASWTTPNNAIGTVDGANAHADAVLGGGSTEARWGGFGFDAVLPAGAKITSVVLQSHDTNSTNNTGFLLAQAYVGGVGQGTHDITSTEADLTADRTWTVEDFSAFAIGEEMFDNDPLTGASSVDLDALEVIVEYELPLYKSQGRF